MESLLDKFMTSSPLQMLLSIIFVFGLVFLVRPDVFRLLFSKKSSSGSSNHSGSITDLLKEIEQLKKTIQHLQDSLDRERSHLAKIENLLKKHETNINLREQLNSLNLDHLFSGSQYGLSMTGQIRMSQSARFDEYIYLAAQLVSIENYASRRFTLNLYRVTSLNSWARTNLMNVIFRMIKSDLDVGLKIILPNNHLGKSLKQNIDKIISTTNDTADVQIILGQEEV